MLSCRLLPQSLLSSHTDVLRLLVSSLRRRGSGRAGGHFVLQHRRHRQSLWVWGGREKHRRVMGVWRQQKLRRAPRQRPPGKRDLDSDQRSKVQTPMNSATDTRCFFCKREFAWHNESRSARRSKTVSPNGGLTWCKRFVDLQSLSDLGMRCWSVGLLPYKYILVLPYV